MICKDCHGEKEKRLRCETCFGMGVEYCCDGLQEQPKEIKKDWLKDLEKGMKLTSSDYWDFLKLPQDR